MTEKTYHDAKVKLPDGREFERSSIGFGLLESKTLPGFFKSYSGTIYKQQENGALINERKKQVRIFAQEHHLSGKQVRRLIKENRKKERLTKEENATQDKDRM